MAVCFLYSVVGHSDLVKQKCSSYSHLSSTFLVDVFIIVNTVLSLRCKSIILISSRAAFEKSTTFSWAHGSRAAFREAQMAFLIVGYLHYLTFMLSFTLILIKILESLCAACLARETLLKMRIHNADWSRVTAAAAAAQRWVGIVV